jgi:hypothetical protein
MLNRFEHNTKIKLNSRPRGNLLPGRRDANDGRDAPAFVACLKRRAHNINLLKEYQFVNEKRCVMPHGITYVARRVKSEVEPTVRDLDEVILNTFAIGQFARVDKFGRAELARPRFLFGIDVDGDHARRPNEGGPVDAAQANAAAAKDGNRRTLCGIDARALILRQECPKRRTDARLFYDGAPACSDATPQQAHLVQWGLLIDGDD